jgi:hypothetical protein
VVVVGVEVEVEEVEEAPRKEDDAKFLNLNNITFL